MIDIVITNYNNGELLTRCLESVARQTLIGNIRVILVDDFSSDGSAERAERLFNRLCGSDIVVICNESNLGCGMARRVGIHKALEFDDSEYTMFLDGDDEITPDVVKDMYVSAKGNDTDISVCKVRFVGGESDGKTHELGKPGVIGVDEFKRRELGKLCGFINNMLIKTSLWRSVEYSSLRYIEDWPTKMRLLHYVGRIAVTDAGYYLYNYNVNSLTKTCSDTKYVIYTALSMIEVCDFYKSVGDIKGSEAFLYPVWLCVYTLRPRMDEVLNDWFDEMDTISRWCEINLNGYGDKDKSEKQGEIQRDQEKDGQDYGGADSQ